MGACREHGRVQERVCTSSLALVVPCFNEADRLRGEIFLEFLRRHTDVRFVFVDDGSTDGTADLLERLQEQGEGRVRLVRLESNCGKAEAVRRGLLAALEERAEYVGYWDADLATPLEELPRFLEVFRQRPGLLLVMGSRVRLLGRDIQRKLHRHLIGRVFATFASLSLELAVYDTQCGAKLLRVQPWTAELLAEPMWSRWLVDIELLWRLRTWLSREGRSLEETVYELPLMCWRDTGKSKVRPWDFLVALWQLWRLRRHYRGRGKRG